MHYALCIMHYALYIAPDYGKPYPDYLIYIGSVARYVFLPYFCNRIEQTPNAMNRKHIFLTALAAVLSLVSCAKATQNNEQTTMKSVVVFFSRSGNNYVSGDIVNLPTGNTKVIAQKIQAATGADLFEIVPQKAYSEDYTRCTEEAQAELQQDARPAYAGDIDLSGYDVIYLGYPIWWGTFPMCVFTFIEAHDGFAGKKVVPFSTHEGSGLGNSLSDLRRLCPDATITQGVAIKGSTVANTDITPILKQAR